MELLQIWKISLGHLTFAWYTIPFPVIFNSKECPLFFCIKRKVVDPRLVHNWFKTCIINFQLTSQTIYNLKDFFYHFCGEYRVRPCNFSKLKSPVLCQVDKFGFDLVLIAQSPMRSYSPNNRQSLSLLWAKPRSF